MRRFLSLALLLLPAPLFADAPKPHIVYFVADDLGWKDVGYHGGEIKTPNIDQLAETGVRLEQFYVQPVCSPTRSSLMTGRYPIRQGLQVGVIRPWADYGLPLEERTLAQALKEAGYYTSICGKWHLGLHERDYLPTQRGFDHQYGHYCGALDYFTHERDGGHDWHRNDKAVYDEGYTTTLLGNEAVGLIEHHIPETPLFLYVPFNAPHTPLQVPDEYLEPYQHIEDQKRQKFCGMVACVDEVIGQVVAALEAKGMRENTLILFHSDNGGPTRLGADNGPLRGGKGSLYEGGVRVPCVMNWPGHLESGEVKGLMHAVDMYPTLITLAGGSIEQRLPLDGKDAWEMIAAGEASPREEILHNLTPGARALRLGDWKLVIAQKNVELFNIAEDPYEKVNLAEQEPQRVKELQARLNELAAEAVPPRNDDGAKPEDFTTPKIWGEPE